MDPNFPLWFHAHVHVGQGSGFNVSGRLESGHVQVGQSVLIQPANEVATVKGTSPYTITLATVTMVMICSFEC